MCNFYILTITININFTFQKTEIWGKSFLDYWELKVRKRVQAQLFAICYSNCTIFFSFLHILFIPKFPSFHKSFIHGSPILFLILHFKRWGLVLDLFCPTFFSCSLNLFSFRSVQLNPGRLQSSIRNLVSPREWVHRSAPRLIGPRR